MNYSNTYTRAPRHYVTGGAGQRIGASLQCFVAYALPDVVSCEPLDAPDLSPTGRIVVSHGVAFLELADREQA